MLIGACSTPISTWSAPGAGGSGRSASSSAARFARRAPYTLRFDGARWSRQRGEAQADLVIQTSPEGWVRFLSADRAGRERWLDRSCVAGTSKSAKEFASAFDRPIDE